MSGVSANFSYATITDNTGMTMLNSSLPEQVCTCKHDFFFVSLFIVQCDVTFSQVSITQQYYYNGFYNNFAIGGNHTTVFCRSAKASFNNNFFLNTYNRFDMVTYNRTQ